jgi:hypothetical protein
MHRSPPVPRLNREPITECRLPLSGGLALVQRCLPVSLPDSSGSLTRPARIGNLRPG